MDFFSELLAGAAANPLIQFLVGVIGFGFFVMLVMAGLNLRIKKMPKGPGRKWAGRLASHALGPGIALFLFGSRVLELPRRGFWGYATALLMGWAGSLAAVGLHHWRKNRVAKASP